MGTDEPEEPQPPLEQKHQNGQRLMEKKASTPNKNSPWNPLLPSAFLFEIRPKLTILATTGQRPSIQRCANPSSNFCSGWKGLYCPLAPLVYLWLRCNPLLPTNHWIPLAPYAFFIIISYNLIGSKFSIRWLTLKLISAPLCDILLSSYFHGLF